MTALHLFDIWNSEETITLWLKTEAGRNIFLTDTYYPRLWVRTFTRKGEGIFRNLLKKNVLSWDTKGENIANGISDRVDLWSGREVSAYPCRVMDTKKMRSLIREADFVCDDLEFYGGDVPLVQGYLLENDTYPLAKVVISETNPSDRNDSSGSRLLWKTLSNRESLAREPLPPITYLSLVSDHGRYYPLGPKNPLRALLSPGESICLEGSPSKILQGLNHILQSVDPDVVFTSGGDEFLLPQLFRFSEETGIAVLLDRDRTPTKRSLDIRSRTFYSYGRIIHKTTAFPLFGRIHLDKRESFFFSEADWEGIMEMAKFARLPLQRIARSSPGTAMSAMEDEIALKKKILIPRVKGKASAIKPLSVLLKVDQGGMTFRPPVGYYENVVELDFRSLYPSLMHVHNISGETVNCECCSWEGSGIPVPFTPYHTCTKRRGIVSDTVEILIRRRDSIKELIATQSNLSGDEKSLWEKRSTALKWCLVTCFGYTGYKNAKYGRREAHESITAWGRYAITQAKELAEDMGYVFLHGLTDSLWLSASEPSLLDKSRIDELSEKVRARLALRLLHEASYSWIVFPSSKSREGYSVPTRYYAREDKGKMKVRGIALRRKNTPVFVDDFQTRLLDLLSVCENRDTIQKREEEFRSIHNEFISRLRGGDWDVSELVVRQNITRRTGDFRANSASKIVLDAILEEGIVLEGGQSIEYIVSNRQTSILQDRYIPRYRFQKGKDSIDRKFYEGLLLDAWEEVMGIFFPEKNLFSAVGF